MRSISLLLQVLSPRARRALEVWALAAATVLASLIAFYSLRLVQSHTFNDISTGNDATPLWLPQLSMAIGTAILAVAFIDELVLELRGERVVLTSEEASHNE